jgi:hypothetical protein
VLSGRRRAHGAQRHDGVAAAHSHANRTVRRRRGRRKHDRLDPPVAPLAEGLDGAQLHLHPLVQAQHAGRQALLGHRRL